MFDSPFEYCKFCGDYVLLDQTQRECAREHRCDGVTKCPLRRFFTGIEFGPPNRSPTTDSGPRRD